jgi:hypothetical protein
MNVPVKEFMVEHFSLDEFINIAKHKNDDLLSNVINKRYTRLESDFLNIIGIKFLSTGVLIFMRWSD